MHTGLKQTRALELSVWFLFLFLKEHCACKCNTFWNVSVSLLLTVSGSIHNYTSRGSSIIGIWKKQSLHDVSCGIFFFKYFVKNKKKTTKQTKTTKLIQKNHSEKKKVCSIRTNRYNSSVPVMSTPGTPLAAGQRWPASESHWSLHRFLWCERRGSVSQQACLSRNPSRPGPGLTEAKRANGLETEQTTATVGLKHYCHSPCSLTWWEM